MTQDLVFFLSTISYSVICIFFSFHPPGHQEAIAVCLHIQTQQTVNDSLCDMVHRPPAMSQACNTEPCPPRYVLSCAPGVHCVWRVMPTPAEKTSYAERLKTHPGRLAKPASELSSPLKLYSSLILPEMLKWPC